MRSIEDVDVVSDGIIVRFSAGLSCYFPADFLLRNAGSETNQIFLDYDPSPKPPVRLTLSALGNGRPAVLGGVVPLRSHNE